MAIRPHHDPGRIVVNGPTGLAGQDVFHAAVQMTRMPMCLADPHHPDMPLVFVNPAFSELTGYAPADAIGRNCRFLQGADTSADAVAQVRHALAARDAVTVEMYNYRKDGSGFWNALYLSPVFDAHGTLIYQFGSQLDVTRRRAAEAVLHRARHLDVLGGMAGSVAHEFNNLLTVVLANLEPMERTADERTLRRLARATDAVHRAAKLTHQTLSFARQPLAGAQPADLRAALAGIDSLIGHVAGRAIQVDLVLPAHPVPVTLDVGQVETMVLTLARSAQVAMPDGGTLRIALASLAPAQVALTITADAAARAPEAGGQAWVDASALAVTQALAREWGGTLRIEAGTTGDGTTGDGTAETVTLTIPSYPPKRVPAQA